LLDAEITWLGTLQNLLDVPGRCRTGRQDLPLGMRLFRSMSSLVDVDLHGFAVQCGR
jgi:hypothetical protein